MPDMFKIHGASTAGIKKHVTPVHRCMPFHEKRSSSAQGYGYKWQKFRERFLKRNPLCAHCMQIGKIEPATEVDHIHAHKGDMRKFWAGPFQPLCKSCHSKKTARENGFSGQGMWTQGEDQLPVIDTPERKSVNIIV